MTFDPSHRIVGFVFFCATKAHLWISSQVKEANARRANSSADPEPLRIANHFFLLWTAVAVDEKRVEGEKRKHKRQISGILQRIRSWELEPVLFKWWNGSPKGPRLRSTQLVTKRSSPSRARGGMINTPDSTQLLNFFIMLFLQVLCK